MLDHLVYAVADLDAGVAAVAERLGVRPAAGGSHPGLGTRNALLGLGARRYLEVIAPDPAQQVAPGWLGVDRIAAPRLVTWAVRTGDLDARVARARAAGLDPGRVVAMERVRGDGTRLAWRLTLAPQPPCDGVVPFLIDWGATPHPAGSAPRGCRLRKLVAQHPDAAGVKRWLAALEVELEVERAPRAALVAVLDTPRGPVELR